MKPIAVVLVLACVALGVWLALPGDPESENPGSDPDFSDSTRQEAALAPRASEPPVPRDLPAVPEAPPSPRPMTVDELIDKHMGPEAESRAPVKTLTPMRQLELVEVTLSSVDKSALDVLLYIAGEAGVRIEASKDIQAELQAAPVTLEVNELSGSSALDLVLRLCSPKLTFSEKADRILIHRK